MMHLLTCQGKFDPSSLTLGPLALSPPYTPVVWERKAFQRDGRTTFMKTRPLAITFCGINAHLLALLFHHFLVLIPNACLKKRGVHHLPGPLGVTKLPIGVRGRQCPWIIPSFLISLHILPGVVWEDSLGQEFLNEKISLLGSL